MAVDSCVFCRIVKGEIPSCKIYEDDDVFAFLDIAPISVGHTLVIPKKHYDNIHSCPPEIISAVSAKLGFIAKAVIIAVGCDSYNVMCNNGKPAGQVVMHIHFHIIPRKENDEVFSQWPAKKYLQGQAEKIAQDIKSQIK